MDALMDENILQKNLFSFNMSMNPDEDSQLIFGEIDQTAYTGDMVYHKVLHQLFWSIKLDDVLIDGKSMGFCDNKRNCLITPDSGTSTITFPTHFFEKFDE